MENLEYTQGYMIGKTNAQLGTFDIPYKEDTIEYQNFIDGFCDGSMSVIKNIMLDDIEESMSSDFDDDFDY